MNHQSAKAAGGSPLGAFIVHPTTQPGSSSNDELGSGDMLLDDGISRLTEPMLDFHMGSLSTSLQDNSDSHNQNCHNSHHRHREVNDVIQPETNRRPMMTRGQRHHGPAQLKFSANKMYGREEEVALLEAAFQKTALVDRQLVLLEGTAGAGKSAVAHQLRNTVQRKAGFFIGGKFDQSTTTSQQGNDSQQGQHQQQQGDEPYAAITMACRELCDSLLAHKENPFQQGNKWQFTFDEVQEKLHAELETDVLQVLTTVFPDLLQILGGNYLATPAVTAEIIGYQEAKEQFKYAVRSLLRVMCSFGRILLFLDDCQWIDAASLDLLKNVITDCKSSPKSLTSSDAAAVDNKKEETTAKESGLLVLVSYRSEEVNGSHPLLALLKDIETFTSKDDAVEYSLEISKVTVDNLTRDQVNDILVDILDAEGPQETSPLADCIHRKTEGNILYVIQFLKALSSNIQETPLLQYNETISKWEWDVEEIRVHESATQNVVEMIQQKLKSLPGGIRKLLPVIALLGASFEYSTFDRVIPHFTKLLKLEPLPSNATSHGEESKEDSGTLSTLVCLTICEAEGVLVWDCKKQQIRWDHDKIQEAALDLVDNRELTKLRIHLGRFLMGSLCKEDQDKNVFILVNLLDAGNSWAPMGDTNRIFLADLNMKAGSKSLRASAFASASGYFSRGIDLLPKDHWIEHYELSLELYSSSAEAHFYTGNLAEAQKCCHDIDWQFGLGHPPLDKRRSNRVKLNIIASFEGSMSAQAECIKMLAECDCKFPKFGQSMYTIGGLLKMGMSVKSLEKKISVLPVMTDPTKRWAMDLLDRLATYTYQNKSDMFAIVVMRAFEITLKYGVCAYTPPVLCMVGMLLGGGLGDIEANNRFGELALKQYNSPEIARTAYARTVFVSNCFCVHLHQPTWDYRNDCFGGYKAAMATGDLDSAFWVSVAYLETGLHIGLPLQPLEKDLHAFSQQMSDLQQEKVSQSCVCLWQVVSNLLGHTNRWPELEKTFGARMDHFEHPYRLLNAFWCGDFGKVVAMMAKHGIDKGEWDKALMCSLRLPTLHFHCAIACFACAKGAKKKKYIKMALKESKLVKGLSKWGNPCLKHYILLVDAEKEGLDKKSFEKSVRLFKEAIQMTGAHKIINDQALAHERLGELYLRHELESDAQAHFDEAFRLYLEWGSAARSTVVFSPKSRQSLENSRGLASDGVFTVS